MGQPAPVYLYFKELFQTMDLQPALFNDLVEITPLKASDFEALYQVASDPLIWEQHPQHDRWKKEVFQSFFDEAMEGQSAFLVLDRATGAVIGSTRFYEYDGANGSVAIGYTFLAREYWGGRYNQSMKKLLLDYAFSFVDKVIFHVGTTNTRSQLALAKIGARQTAEWADNEKPGKPAHYEYEISRNDWLANESLK